MIFFSDLTNETAGVTDGVFISPEYTTLAEVTTVHVFAAAGGGGGSAQTAVQLSTDGTNWSTLFAAMDPGEAVNVYGEIGILLRLKVNGIDRTTTMSATTGVA